MTKAKTTKQGGPFITVKGVRILGLGLLAALVLGVGLMAQPKTLHAEDAMEYTFEEDCENVDNKDGFTGAILEANRAYVAGAIKVANDTFRQHRTNSYASCMIKIIDYFDKIKLLLSSVIGMLGAIILALVAAILNWACQYVVNAINALLASVCLPIPSIGFSLSMPGTPSASCDGFSLLNLMQAQGGFSTSIPYSQTTNGMSLGLDQLIKTK